MGDNFEWSSPDTPPASGPPNWALVPPPEGPPSAGPQPGGPDATPRRRGRTVRTVAIATVTAGALALVGASVASAQSSGTTTTLPAASPATTTPATTPATPKPGGPRGFRGGDGFPGMGGPGGFRGPGGFGGGGAIHGEFVRPNGSGYQTIDSQFGIVQPGVSATSIEVKSADGFDKKYTVSANTVVNSGRDGIGSVKAGDSVEVEAVVTGNTTEASSIVDTTTLGSIQGHWKPVRPAAPSTPPTTTG